MTTKQSNIFDLARQPNPFILAAREEMVPIMTGSGSRNGTSGTADKLPMTYRTGSMDAAKLPSRIGDTLRFPDGSTEAVKRSPVYADPFYHSDEQAITNQIQAGY
jgi:hypothetical protein